MVEGLKLFIVVNVDWFFLSHRLPIALRAKELGYDVTIMAMEEENMGDDIRAHGLKFIALPTTRGGKNPFKEINVLRFMHKVYKREKPDIVHHVTLKPVLYGSIAAKMLGVPKVINAISGMGSTFINANKLSPIYHLIRNMYRLAFSNKNVRVIVQNEDDQKAAPKLGKLNKDQIFLIKGSGVDVSKFAYVPEPEDGPVKLVLLARLLYDKGVGEYVAAAERLKKKYGDGVHFILGGKLDPHNATGIPEEKLKQWTEEGNVEWIGYFKDVKGLYERSHIAVLPSYREGLPKALIEGMAIGRPVVTTDVPGCRVVVKHLETGFLVKVQDVESLHDAMDQLIADKNLRVTMGEKGRTFVEEEFSLKMVVEKTMDIYLNS